jgi:hypothetical protein
MRLPYVNIAAIAALLQFSGVVFANECHVIGDTSGNDLSQPLGSMTNPYGTLAALQADTGCDTLIVLYSEFPLDGGITLRNGQELLGYPGPSGMMPVISNTSASANDGHGIRVAAKNSIKSLHVTNTYNRGISGVGVESLSINDLLITEFGNSGMLIPNTQGTLFAPPGIFVETISDARITIENSELADGVSNGIYLSSFSGNAKIVIEGVTIRDGRDVGQEFAQGIGVFSLWDAAVDLKVIDAYVTNAGEGLTDGISGIAFFADGISSMKFRVDGFDFINPDFSPFETGLTIGAIVGSASIQGEVKNSIVRNATADGINILGIFGVNHSIDLLISNNEIYDSGTGILLRDLFSSSSVYNIDILKNRIVNTGIGLYNEHIFTFANTANLFLEKNSIANAFIGLLNVINGPDTFLGFNVDAGNGGLGSNGKNRFVNTFLDAIADGPMIVKAQNNWWGDAGGPDIVIGVNGGAVDFVPFLTTDPQDD